MGNHSTATATAVEQPDSTRARIESFKERVRLIAGHKIHDVVIWKFAHYKSDAQWKKWKSGRLHPDSSAATTFGNIVAMPPAEFVEELKKQQSKTNLKKFF